MTTQAGYTALDAARFETPDYLLRPVPPNHPRRIAPDDIDAARDFFHHALQACANEGWCATASGSMRRIFSDAPDALYRPPLGTAWRALTSTLGIEGIETPLTWWMNDAYGRDYHIGFTSPKGVARLIDELDAADFATRGVPLLEASCGNPRYVEDLRAVWSFLRRAKERGDWVVALESGS